MYVHMYCHYSLAGEEFVTCNNYYWPYILVHTFLNEKGEKRKQEKKKKKKKNKVGKLGIRRYDIVLVWVDGYIPTQRGEGNVGISKSQ